MKHLGLMLALFAAACGDNGTSKQPDGGPQIDAPGAIDAPIDGPITPETLTSFTIDLVLNHTDNTDPRPFADFATLPDPDGQANNTAAYNALF
ncbi:MAG: hypothetical protein H0T79_21650 [Deltaproteobacteria bacterium]|nr:hypothetical protein [Deltaproteobacteria bacterium]